jgi:hypothetical protein
MSLQESVLKSARFRTWLLHPSGKDVNSVCVGWTKHAFANPLAYWVRSLLPEALAEQVSGVNWRWGLLIGDGNCFPLPMWARFFAKAIEDLDPVPTGFPSMITAEDALRLLALCEEMALHVTLPGHAPEQHPACCNVCCTYGMRLPEDEHVTCAPTDTCGLWKPAMEQVQIAIEPRHS